jgi:hypothetical protein
MAWNPAQQTGLTGVAAAAQTGDRRALSSMERTLRQLPGAPVALVSANPSEVINPFDKEGGPPAPPIAMPVIGMMGAVTSLTASPQRSARLPGPEVNQAVLRAGQLQHPQARITGQLTPSNMLMDRERGKLWQSRAETVLKTS